MQSMEMQQSQPVLPFKVYMVTAPFRQGNSGDGDYVDGIVQLLGGGLNCQYVTLDKWQYRKDFHHGPILSSIRNNGHPTEIRQHLAMRRVQAVEYILNMITQDKDDRPKVLNLQLRPPDNGTLFTPEDLQLFKANDITAVITCHEYKLNKSWEAGLNIYSQSLFVEADQVMFFNQQDLATAVADSNLPIDLQAKCCLTHLCTALTLKMPRGPVIEYDKRPPNILMFGLMRQGKGFEEVASLGNDPTAIYRTLSL